MTIVKRFNILTLLLSIAAAAAAAMGGVHLLSHFEGILSTEVIVGCQCAAVVLIVGLAVLVSSLITGFFISDVITASKGPALIPVFVILGAILAFFLGFGAQKLYSDNSRTEPTSYLFLLDNSGSMTDNDPDKLRYDAMEKILNKKDSKFNYSVILFGDDVNIAVEYVPVGSGTLPRATEPNGLTAFWRALSEAYDYIQNNRGKAGSHPAVILLSDGFPTDEEDRAPDILDKYCSAGVAINCVGLGESDEELLKDFSQRTGGVYESAERADDLIQAMLKASDVRAITQVNSESNNGFLASVIKIVFMTLLGTLVGAVCAICCGVNSSVINISITGLCKGFLAGLLLAFAHALFPSVSGSGIPDTSGYVWIAACIIVGLTVFTAEYYQEPDGSKSVQANEIY